MHQVLTIQWKESKVNCLCLLSLQSADMTADSLYSSNALLGAGGVAQVAEYMLSELEALNCPQYHQKKNKKKKKEGKKQQKML
jgi:hypothetical protein